MSKESQAEKREKAAVEGKAAMVERAQRAAFVEKNTVRLREMRLAKEAAEREALAAAPPPPKTKAKAKKVKSAG